MDRGGLRRSEGRPHVASVRPLDARAAQPDERHQMKLSLVGSLGGLLLLSLLGTGGPSGLHAQRDGAQALAGTQWAPISIGARAGWDGKSRALVLGAQLRIPILRNGSVELMPNADITFRTRLKEYQLNLELVYVAGRDEEGAGLYGGGGVGFRNSLDGDPTTAARETFLGYSLVGGARSARILGPLTAQVEFRWIFLSETQLNPQHVTFGINYPLWGPSRPES